MGEAIRLAWSLVRIRHLAFSLFLFPLAISVALVLGQLLITELLMQSAGLRHSEAEVATTENNPVRLLLYGSGEERPLLKVCRWIPAFGSPNIEVPPDRGCRPDRLDVALRADDPATASTSEYERLFQGQIDRLHVCRACSPDIIITMDSSGKRISRAGSAYGLAVLSLAFTVKGTLKNDRSDYLKMLSGDIGTISLQLPEAERPIEFSKTNGAVPFTANVVPIVVIALWLSLRAHRKVLDYFARNDVLLPLVAATGKRPFYTAIWLLTAMRVACFLAASLPILYFGLKDIGGEDVFMEIGANKAATLLWLVALSSAVALSTIIGSIADLKHRQAFVNVLYRYIPVAVAMSGGVLWVATFLVPSVAAGTMRLSLTAVPVVGLVPLFIAPITRVGMVVLLIHAVCSGALVIMILRSNARWFAAHLEEV
jgi:hypothetical protein